jgi:uncharacterized Fe-S cluster protein YjdI
MSIKRKEYTQGDLTIIWQPDLCIHSGICARELSEVFRPRETPWVKIDAASQDAIINQVKKCPSGALTYKINNEMSENQSTEERVNIQVIPNGPMIVHANMCVTMSDGSEVNKDTKASYCRCGASENKPFCDGAHKRIEFKG